MVSVTNTLMHSGRATVSKTRTPRVDGDFWAYLEFDIKINKLLPVFVSIMKPTLTYFN